MSAETPAPNDPSAETPSPASPAASAGGDEPAPDFKKGQVSPWALLGGVVVILSLAAIVAVTGLFGGNRRASPRNSDKEGCPCGCDHSEAMARELRVEGGETALDTIETTLKTIAEREDAGYITEAMVEHRLRLLGVQSDLAPARGTEGTSRFLGMPSAGDRGVPLPNERRLLRQTPIVEDTTLRVRAELTAHGEATEIVRGHEKLLRASFRLGMQIENITGAKLTLAEPTLDGSVSFPVSRWYVVGSDGRRWDGVVEAGEKRAVNVIGYLGEPVKPGTEIEATVHLGSLGMHVSTRARRRWNREE